MTSYGGARCGVATLEGLDDDAEEEFVVARAVLERQSRSRAPATRAQHRSAVVSILQLIGVSVVASFIAIAWSSYPTVPHLRVSKPTGVTPPSRRRWAFSRPNEH